jgi:hypothetical protein
LWHKIGKTRAIFSNGVVKGFKKLLVLYNLALARCYNAPYTNYDLGVLVCVSRFCFSVGILLVFYCGEVLLSHLCCVLACIFCFMLCNV